MIRFVPLFGILIYVVCCNDVDNHDQMEVTLDERNLGEMKSVCQNFSFGNVYTGEFSTPNYPDLYPADIECVRVIHAPPEHLIHLDFRGSVFEIERSESTDKCQFDYLEVRNGPYGFSPLIGKFCGKKYPPAITGDAGSMWLYFRSDRSLQYKGFKAVHYFSPAKEKLDDNKIMCSFSNNPLDEDGEFSTEMMRDVLEEIANSTEYSAECVWKLETTSPEQRLRLRFDEFHLAFPNECKMNFLEIYGGNTAIGHHLKQFCGRSASVITTNSHKVYIRIHLLRGAIPKTSIKASYTMYVPGKNCSSESLFACGDDTCVSTRLLCNGRSNCMSDSDEKRCPTPIPPSFRQIYGPYLVILIVILLIIAVIITCIAVMNLCPRFNKRNINYAPVPLNSTVFSSSPPNHVPSANASNCDMVYSTVVPGPDHQGRLYELLPKMSSEDLHLYLCKQGCLLNGKLPNANHVSKTDTIQKARQTPLINEMPPMVPLEKRLKIVDHVDPSSVDSSISTPPPSKLKTPDVVLNGLMKKKKRSTYGNRGLPLSKSVKFFNADSIDETSSEQNYQSSPIRKVSKSISHPAPLSSSTYNDGIDDSSSDTLENLSQVTANRITDSDDDHHEDSPIRALTSHRNRRPSPKTSPAASEGFVLSI